MTKSSISAIAAALFVCRILVPAANCAAADNGARRCRPDTTRNHEFNQNTRTGIDAFIYSALYDGDGARRRVSRAGVERAGARYSAAQYDEMFAPAVSRIRRELESPGYDCKGDAALLLEVLIRRASLNKIKEAFPEGAVHYLKSLELANPEDAAGVALAAEKIDAGLKAKTVRRRQKTARQSSANASEAKDAILPRLRVSSWHTNQPLPPDDPNSGSTARSAEKEVEECYNAPRNAGNRSTPSVGPVGDTSYIHKELLCQLEHGTPEAREAAADRFYYLRADAKGDIGALIDSALYNAADRARWSSCRSVWSAGAGYDQAEYDQIFLAVMPQVRKELDSRTYKYKASAVSLIEFMIRSASLNAIDRMFPEGPCEYIRNIDFGSQTRENVDVDIRAITRWIERSARVNARRHSSAEAMEAGYMARRYIIYHSDMVTHNLFSR